MQIRFLVACGAALTQLATPAESKGLFDGKWVADLSTQSGLSEDIYLVQNGIYTCNSCSPLREYPADGKLHSIPGDSEITTESVAVTGPRTIVTRIVSPALARTTTMTVAADDKTATYVSIDHRPGIKGPLRTVYLARRTKNGPSGAHAVSGTWQGIRYVAVPKEVRTTELRKEGDRLFYRTPLGVSFVATYGGGFVPVEGPFRGKFLVSVEREGNRKIVETVQQDGKIIALRSFKLAPNGRSIEIATTNVATHSVFRTTARKQ